MESLLIQSGAEKKTQLIQYRFSHIYIYQNTQHYISNSTQSEELYDCENCIKKYFTLNILYVLENDL